MIENWAIVEADFRRFYQVDPFDLTWRKFINLLGGLPGESQVMRAAYKKSKEEDDDTHWWRSKIATHFGRQNRSAKVIQIDDYMRQE